MTLNIDKSTVKRVNELRKVQDKPSLFLRVRVDGGGCSGFQYHLDLTEEKKESDLIFDDVVLSDDISMGFLNGATIAFEEGLIGSEFTIKNPNATAGCGCGTSFSVM
ncbi:MAG: HesB/IscA family protein [Alphaproteobacteria bacterium]